ncbi:MAG: hypothetical protein ACTHLW_01105, partial [Verrucomicrobiota bacterium]
RRSKGRTTAPTTAQSLGALLKSARDIMRKDKRSSIGSSLRPAFWPGLNQEVKWSGRRDLNLVGASVKTCENVRKYNRIRQLLTFTFSVHMQGNAPKSKKNERKR